MLSRRSFNNQKNILSPSRRLKLCKKLLTEPATTADADPDVRVGDDGQRGVSVIEVSRLHVSSWFVLVQT
jgi:hypothetical protein